MFSWGLPDDLTVTALLQAQLQQEFPQRSVSVRNYGCPYFNSSQELALFAAELRQATRPPDLAIFLDGLNDTHHGRDVVDLSDIFALETGTGLVRPREDPDAAPFPPLIDTAAHYSERAMRHLVDQMSRSIVIRLGNNDSSDEVEGPPS